MCTADFELSLNGNHMHTCFIISDYIIMVLEMVGEIIIISIDIQCVLGKIILLLYLYLVYRYTQFTIAS